MMLLVGQFSYGYRSCMLDKEHMNKRTILISVNKKDNLDRRLLSGNAMINPSISVLLLDGVGGVGKWKKTMN